jgi:hypothetical protein
MIEPKAVASFLLLDPNFPRSVRYCLGRIQETLRIVSGRSLPGAPDALECLSGLTLARWSYTSIDDLISGGLHEAIDDLQSDLNSLHNLIEERYFVAASPSPPEASTPEASPPDDSPPDISSIIKAQENLSLAPVPSAAFASAIEQPAIQEPVSSQPALGQPAAS